MKRRPPTSPMTHLDRRTVRALEAVSFGLATDTGRVVRSLRHAADNGNEITVRQRRALYAIAFRFRAQIADKKLLADVAIALADAQAAFELSRQDSMQIPMPRQSNPLDDFFRSASEAQT